MNKANLKSYAPQARKDFITAVTARASLLGITASHVSPATVSGGVALIDGVEWPAKVAAQRQALLDRIARHSAPTAQTPPTGQGGQHTISPAAFQQTMEEVAYTWFNRFAALRYMELHELIDHGHRVLSSRDGGLPELLRHAAEVSLPGIHTSQVQALQLAGNQDNALYKQLLVAQCNELSRTMPFLFERIDDDTELLLPDNLLRTDSIIAKLVAGVPEADWEEIEVIGWLYQFYISEKKDQVIGKVVKSEDIPAATQLFTPNWIVQYLVQNSVGRLWLMANPTSTLAQQWPYYIQPAEQAPEVQAQLDALIHTRVAEDGGSHNGVLNPETITCLDPACGSGHILVVAYDVLKAIYLERGYRLRDIPRLILEKNLYGLDIDDRAAQLAGFALLMKARADDRRLLADPANPPKLNVLALQSSQGLDAAALAQALQPTAGTKPEHNPFAANDLFPDTQPQRSLTLAAAPPAPNSALHTTLAYLLPCFEHAKTFGSLIKIDPYRLPVLKSSLSLAELALQHGDLYAKAAAQDLLPLLRQALVLGMQFDAVVANPPYMGGNSMSPELKSFAASNYSVEKNDLYAMMISRSFSLTKENGHICFVTMHMWMYIGAFEEFRRLLVAEKSIHSLCHLGVGAFSEISGEVVKTVAFALGNSHVGGLVPVFLDLQDGDDSHKDEILRRGKPRFERLTVSDFLRVPSSVICYQAPPEVIDQFDKALPLERVFSVREGMTTADNTRFLRLWWEVKADDIGITSIGYEQAKSDNHRWWRYQKGGESRKWFGNNEFIVNWRNDGQDIRANSDPSTGRVRSHNYNDDFSCREGATWSTIGSAPLSVRYAPSGSLFDTTGIMGFSIGEVSIISLLAFMNSSALSYLLKLVSPMLRFKIKHMLNLPFDVESGYLNLVEILGKRAIEISKVDWDRREISIGFEQNELMGLSKLNLSTCWDVWFEISQKLVIDLQEIETQNNRVFIDAYGLQDELSPEVPEDQITLTRADREKDCQRLISYAIGCMMGRYSLDAPGLIYAHAGNVGFDASRYTTFPADADGILPLTGEHWFADDAAERVREFLLAVWGPDTLEENMAWLAESLRAKAAKAATETPADTIRRYVANQFFKDHLQTYKKRPIYWLFSSGKQGAFQALVYLHRYNESTLARMRAEYVIPLTAKMANRLEMLEQDTLAATSTAARTKLRKQTETLRKQQAELLAFDEKLRHHADMRITLDLDDGVKVNYGKFGDLLEGVKLVTGGSGDE